MTSSDEYEKLVRLHGRALARYLQQVIFGYIDNLIDILCEFIFPLLYILYHCPEALKTLRPKPDS